MANSSNRSHDGGSHRATLRKRELSAIMAPSRHLDHGYSLRLSSGVFPISVRYSLKQSASSISLIVCAASSPTPPSGADWREFSPDIYYRLIIVTEMLHEAGPGPRAKTADLVE